MSLDGTDLAWNIFGEEDPYWAVLTQDRFRKQVLDEAGRREFFASGERHMDWVFSMIRQQIDPRFKPARGLDFGCGVGRLLLPIASRCQSAVGIDVSDGMLREAAKVCQQEKILNVSLVKGDDDCSGLTPGFDFINSFIVFQHIPTDRGARLFRRLLELLDTGGVGAIHLTYSRSQFPVDSGDPNYQPQKPGFSLGGWHHLAGVKHAIRQRLARMVPGRPTTPTGNPAPTMQMISYLLNPLFQVLQQAGVRDLHLAFCDHSDALGVVLFFKKGPGVYLLPALIE
jgi:SAM-dependent methyltransferase